jgi:hypothetical protein
MSYLSFEELTNRLENELHRLHYTEGSIAIYRRMWQLITAFVEMNGISHFTEDAGICFLDSQNVGRLPTTL